MAFVPVGQRPVAYIDTETTGLNASSHEIIEIAVVFDLETATRFQIPHLTVDTELGVAYYTTRIRPLRIEDAEPIALKVNGYTPEAWEGAPTFTEIAPILQVLLKDTIPVAHNASFDMDFIQESFKRIGSTFRCDYHKIDTVTLAWACLVPKGLEKLSLDTIRTFLGWPKDGGHRALQDALDARKLYHLAMSEVAT